MILCNVKPDSNVCYGCLDVQVSCGIIEDCKQCIAIKKDVMLISTHNGFFGPKAIVAIDGNLKEVSIDRVYNVHIEGV